MSRQAAEYVRMSTEHQQYSTANQRDCIAAYAAARGIEIVRSYADEGRSGISIDGRQGLQSLLQDVVQGNCGFQLVLVYDVSRWGRFQDADESAHYEFLCRRAGIEVHYCAEQFTNDGSPVSSIIKGMKRVMAAEYSRELSHKVYAGMVRITLLGYRTAGRAGYGLQRVLIGSDGTRKAVMKDGDRKQFQTDRVVLEPGLPPEVEVVRNIFRWVSQEGETYRGVVQRLNAAGITYSDGTPWGYERVRRIITNEKYIGANVFGRTTQKLRGNVRRLPREEWVTREGAFEPVVDRKTFDMAQRVIQSHRRLSDDVLLRQARAVLSKHGRLTVRLLDKAGPHSYGTFVLHFGSFEHLCERLACVPDRRQGRARENEGDRKLERLMETTAHRARSLGYSVQRRKAFGRLSIEHRSVQFQLIEPRQRGGKQWCEFRLQPEADFFVVLRPSGPGFEEDYFFFPSSQFHHRFFEICGEDDLQCLGGYRFDSLDFVDELAEACSASFHARVASTGDEGTG